MQNIFNVKIGLECHIQINSKSKLFSNSRSSYSNLNNIFINEIDLGFPGILPSVNKYVVESAIKLSHALNATIVNKGYFTRKHYFYSDLPKGYQITQLDSSISYGGSILLNKKQIHIDQIQIEEDTGKSFYDKHYSYINYNRCGVALLEIVTKPEIKNAKEAILFIKKLKNIIKYLNISTGKMNEGALRVDVNISLNQKNNLLVFNKVEIKNINSIKCIAYSIKYEIKRHMSLFKQHALTKKETRFWNTNKKKTIILRNKEKVNDYKFLLEPDIPFLYLSYFYINKIKNQIPLSSSQNVYQAYNIFKSHHVLLKLISKDKILMFYILQLLKKSKNHILIINWIASLISVMPQKNILAVFNYVHLNNLHYFTKLISIKILNRLAIKNLFLLYTNQIKHIQTISTRKFIKDIIYKYIIKLSYLNKMINIFINSHIIETKKISHDQSKILHFFIGKILQNMYYSNILNKMIKIILINIAFFHYDKSILLLV